MSAETRLRPILLRSANINALSFVWTRVEERRGTTAVVECRYYTNTPLCVVPGLLPKQKNKYLKKVRTSLAPSFAFLDGVVTCAFQCHCSIQTFLSIAKAYMNLFFHVDKNIPFFITFFCFLDSHIFVVLNILFTTPVCPLRLRLLASNVVWTNLPLLVVNEQQIPQRVTAANLKAYKRRVLQPPRTKKTIKKTSSGSGVPAFPLLHPTCFIHGCVTVHCRRRVS